MHIQARYAFRALALHQSSPWMARRYAAKHGVSSLFRLVRQLEAISQLQQGGK